MILPARGEPVPRAALVAAAEALRAGLVVGIPTDTVYGLAVDPTVPGATDRLFEAKRRPRAVDLPVLVATPEQALLLATAVPVAATRLMDRFWPGPVTIVLPRAPEFTGDLGEDEATVGVRCPDHPVPRALCAEVGPLATTSANRHGEPTHETAAAVEDDLGDAVAVVLDGGRCTGSPSTVVDCTGVEPRLLREGRVPWPQVLATI
ncbi:MAG: L-threonylcarbamoyladenylate synthase [Acidimicrobiia bacterium]